MDFFTDLDHYVKAKKNKARNHFVGSVSSSRSDPDPGNLHPDPQPWLILNIFLSCIQAK